MIGYGIACLIVCCLSAFDRRAMPFALTVLLGWLVGYVAGWGNNPEAILKAWMTISLVSSLVLFSLYRLDQQRRWMIVAAIAVAMLGIDVIYSWLRLNGIPAEIAHSKALDAGLTAQLFLIGYRGACNAGVLFWRGVRRYLPRRRMAAVPTASRKKEAAE